jgi:hypothetical protein
MTKKFLAVWLAVILIISFFTLTVYAVSAEQNTADYLMEYIGHFMQRRTAPLVEPTQAILTLVSKNGIAVKESQDIFSYEVKAAKELSSWRDLFVLEWGGYSHFDIELTLLSYDICADNAVLLVCESTKLYFAKELGPNLEYTAWKFNRIFVFEKVAYDWILVLQDIISDSPILPPNEPI